MTTLAAGSSVTFTLGSFQTLNIKTGGVGTLLFTSVAPNAVPSFTAAAVNGNFGPYNTSMTVVMTMTAGSAEYTLTGGADVTAVTDAGTGINIFSASGISSLLGCLGLPMVLPSSGTIGAAGALSLTTSVPLSGGYTWGCYMWFPANAAYSGSTAGLYYVVMNSNNAGTVYNNKYTSGIPAIPGSPTAIATGGGAYTQELNQQILATFTLPANVLGKNGQLRIEPVWDFPSNGNQKSVSIYFGATLLFGKTRTASTLEIPLVDVRNRGTTGRQVSGYATSAGPATSSSNAVVTPAEDTTVAVDITFRGQLAAPTDFIVLEAASVFMTPFP